ncbi:MAG: peptidoglycan DD-metalloendopeptidase family protein [Flavobacteriaceae bacterium]|jgi:murein DD-endopeptidase MepM/ murein hydrolase activator NlpD|nr:peptidoglycan DD-metalloendopeptidase family protein [Flavobacteriaceae bacterium]
MRLYIFLLSALITLVSCQDKEDKKVTEPKELKEKSIVEYGFVLNDFIVERDTIKSGDTFGKLLENYNLGTYKSHEITEKVKDSFNLRNIRIGHPYTVLKDKNDPHVLKAFIYEINNIRYSVVDLRDSISAYNRSKPITIKKRTIATEIEGSLFETLAKTGTDINLAISLAKIYEFSIDFFKIQKGDKFAAVFYEKFINDTIYAGVEKLEASFFEHKGKKQYAFPFKKDSGSSKFEYYDENAKELKAMFLKAPLDFFRITSKFNPKRFHPVQKTWKAHNGTDYAAPHGTPIRATAAGVVERTGYTAGNGNYVKVKHNGTYSTQYLHMSKILVKNKQRVSQGEIIGKVGSTGLATGPHVCYRFWKNGVQVDPLREKPIGSEPMEEHLKPRYFEEMKPMKKELDSIASTVFKD